MAKRKGAAWWRMFYHQRTAIDMLPNEAVGEALKAAYRYFDGEPVEEAGLSREAQFAFALFRQAMDESIGEYNASVENGRNGGNKRWHKE
jgi:hypothetical protein